MTDLPDDRRDESPSPPADPTAPPAGDVPGDEPRMDDAPPQTGGPPHAGGPPPAGDVPPAGPPPAAPGSTPQAQWPQQQTGMTASDQRNWAVGAHLGALAASAVTGLAILGPLLVYLIKKDEDVFVREHSREALNFQLTWLIGGFLATVLGVIVSVLTVGFALIVLAPAAIGFVIAWIVFVVKASMAASRGEYYRYPLTIRMVS